MTYQQNNNSSYESKVGGYLGGCSPDRSSSIGGYDACARSSGSGDYSRNPENHLGMRLEL
jgi:hypothetical protein